jgi:glycosyltransferase involved in cell wall biosynthesis
MNHNFAPIVLFCYNRPLHLSRTIESLKENILSNQSQIYIFSDGSKNKDDVACVSEVRRYLDNLTGFREIILIKNESNKGLAANIKDGLDYVFNYHDRAIIIEDDLEFSPVFLKFMNECLEIYKEDRKVMHISGYMFPVETSGLSELLFLKPTTCWGWATWKRAWINYKKDPDFFVSKFSPEMINDFNLNGSYNYWNQILLNKEGKLNTWAIFWYASVYLANGLSLHPKVSLVKNRGADGSGSNFGKSNFFEVNCIENNQIKVTKEITLESKIARERVELFFKSSSSFITRLRKLTLHKLLQKLIRFFKATFSI